jgi:hypothetical protein
VTTALLPARSIFIFVARALQDRRRHRQLEDLLNLGHCTARRRPGAGNDLLHESHQNAPGPHLDEQRLRESLGDRRHFVGPPNRVGQLLENELLGARRFQDGLAIDVRVNREVRIVKRH